MGTLRMLLALSVVNSHGGYFLGIPLLIADMSVQVFYVISGFYMALVLNEKYLPGKTTYFDFISNRFLRIFPCYFIVLLLNILMFFGARWYLGHNIGPFGLWSTYWEQFDWYAKLLLVFSHLALFGQDAYFFLGMDGQYVNGLGGLHFDPNWMANHNGFFQFLLMPQTWTISLELCFYLLAPFLVRRSAKLIALMILASLALRFVLAFSFHWQGDPWSHRFFLLNSRYFYVVREPIRYFAKCELIK